MNTKRVTFAVAVVGLLVAAAVVAGTRLAVGLDGLIGYGAVIALLALAATEYRFDLRRVIGLK
ncbi:MAG TPA: hypothetical protein VFT72_08870 [Opitutaceae bacterium]|nr:hypothetical protein [Opitutaceae bacterium]